MMIKLVPIANELDTARARPMYLSATMLVFGEGRRPAATEWEDGCEVQANPASADCKEGIVPRVAKINRRPEHCTSTTQICGALKVRKARKNIGAQQKTLRLTDLLHMTADSGKYSDPAQSKSNQIQNIPLLPMWSNTQNHSSTQHARVAV